MSAPRTAPAPRPPGLPRRHAARTTTRYLLAVLAALDCELAGLPEWVLEVSDVPTLGAAAAMASVAGHDGTHATRPVTG